MARTNIVLDDKLIRKIMQLTGAKSMREAVDMAMRTMVAQDRMQNKLSRLSGKLVWEGNLDAWRRHRK